MVPTIPVYDSDKTIATTHGFGRGDKVHAPAYGTNPFATVNNGDTNSEFVSIRGNVWAEVTIFDFLKYKLNLGADIMDSNRESWSKGYGGTLGAADGKTSATSSWTRRYNYLVENTLAFNKKIKQHNINAVVGQTFQKTRTRNASASKQDLIEIPGGGFLHTVNAALQALPHQVISLKQHLYHTSAV